MYFFSHHLPMDGYGYAGFKIRDALAGIGVRVRAVDMLYNEGYTEYGQWRWRAPQPAVALCVPEWWADIETPALVGYTMFESTRMPEEKVAAINAEAAACVVPCEWCRDMFREQGVTAPLYVVRWGIDPADYYPLERNGHRPYTFLWSGTPDKRKGWDLTYRAFRAAFGDDPDVMLVLHFRKMPRCLSGCNDDNVTMVAGMMGRQKLRSLLKAADCFVWPSRGEGWGLPPREAAATGIPALVTNWSGLAEELEHWGLPIDVAGLEPAEFNGWDPGEVGEWAIPDFDHLVWQMRWVRDNQGIAAAAAREAARWLAQNATWKRTALGLAAVWRQVC